MGVDEPTRGRAARAKALTSGGTRDKVLERNATEILSQLIKLCTLPLLGRVRFGVGPDYIDMP